jgi:hypothetical protein
MGNGKGVALRSLDETCGALGDSCGRPELPRRDADEPLEVTGELALVREAGARRDLRKGEVALSLLGAMATRTRAGA